MATDTNPRTSGAVDLLTRTESPIDAPVMRGARRFDRGPIALVLVAEMCAAVAWAVAAETVHGSGLRIAVAAIAVALVLARVVAGSLRDGGRGAVGWLLVACCRVTMVAPALVVGRDVRLSALLAAASAVPLCAAALPAHVFRGVGWARREDLPGALLLSALFAGAGVLVAIAFAPGALEGDLPALVPYAAAAAGVLGMVEVLAQHRAGAGFADTVATIGIVATAVAAAVAVSGGSEPADAGVSAALAAAGVLAAGLLVATALASPRPVVLDRELAAGGPRAAVPAVAGLVLLAIAVRVLSFRPLWIDEADVAGRIHGASARSLIDRGGHPPLYDVLAWASAKAVNVSAVALRLPSLVAGALLVVVVYVTATELYDRRVGVVAAAIAAVAPSVVWFSDVAQPTAVTALLAVVALWAMLRAVRAGRAIHWLLLAASGSALLWAHPLGYLHVAVLNVGVGAVVVRCVRQRHPLGRLVVGWLASLGATVVAFVALLAHGLGSRFLVPPFEYATNGAPGGGRSVFGLVNAATTTVLGFHPPDITSRLLALWPLSILAAFVVFGRRWSLRGGLLVALALAPFVFLLGAQIAGSPREPAYAVEWVATAVPMLAIGVARAISLAGPWPRVRTIALGIGLVLCVAAVDQRARVEPFRRFDLDPVMRVVHRDSRAGDAVVYAPAQIGDLVHYEATNAKVVPLARAAEVANAKRIEVVAAFGLGDSQTSQETLALVKQLSASRRLVSRHGTDDVRVWVFA